MHYQANEPTRDLIVAGFFLSLLLTTVAAFVGLSYIMAAGISLMLTLAAALGALRNESLGAFKPFLIAALIAWLLFFGLIHSLPNDPQRLFGGLTQATAAAVYGLWLAPLLLVTLPYAWLFHREVLDEDTLRALTQESDQP